MWMWELPTCASVTSHVGDLVSGRIGVIVSLPVPSYNVWYMLLVWTAFGK